MQNITQSLLEQFMAVNATDDVADDIKDLTKTMTVGLVVNADDPLENGRLMIFCPALNDNPKKIHHLPWATYVSPFGGSINNSCYTRGHIAGQETSSGSVAYGFWGIPEVGAHVLVGCINGDPRRRFWVGCFQPHQETHSLFGGRYDWTSGFPDGPLTSDKTPLEPTYTNLGKAFEDDRESAEWKTRGADYQPTAVREDIGEPPNDSKQTYLDNQYQQISDAESDDWVKPIVGAHGYDWDANKRLGSFKSSKVYGMTTPGLHLISLDDRAYNSRMKLRTSAGHQIILDDTNERIYVSTMEGKSYIEMDKSGNIDVFAEKRVSMHSKQDINIESDELVRIKGKKGIHMYAGDTTGQTPLESIPADGQIRMHSTDDIHIMCEANLRALVQEDALWEIGGSFYASVGENYFLQVENDINTITNSGDMNTSITGNLNLNVSSDISQFAGNNTKHQSVNDVEVMAYRGKMDMGSQMDMTISSKGENVGIESEMKAVNVTASESQTMAMFDGDGATMFSEKAVSVLSKEDVQVNVSEELTTEYMTGPLSGCIEPNGVRVRFTDANVDFDAPTDISFKLPGNVEEKVSSINSKFNEISSAWNSHMQNMDEFFGGIASAITNIDPSGLAIPALTGGIFPIAISGILPSLEFPSLNLPNVCLDLTSLLEVDDFNLVPESLFELNVDLGGWSKDSIKGWVNGMKNDFEQLKRSVDVARDLEVLETEINNVIAEFEGIQLNVDNMVDVNITGNTAEYFALQANLGTMQTTLETYNTQAGLNGVPQIPGIISNVNSQGANTDIIAGNMSPTEVDGYNYSDLQASSDTLGQYISDLGGGP